MAGRWGRPLNPFKDVWDRLQADELYEFLLSLWKGMTGLQGTPSDPTEIQAGVAADIGTSQPPAKADHTHSVETAAPSVDVALGGTTDEGSGSALMRADARLKLAAGETLGDILYWNGSSWVSTPPTSIAGLRIPGIMGDDGEDGPMGPPGIRGADGVAGAAGVAGPPGYGFDGEDGADGYPIPGPMGPQGPAGGGGGGGSWTEVEIDFGSTPVYEASFTITDAAITSSSVKVVIVPSGKAATGRTADDWQWDGGTFAANPGTGSAECYAKFFPGPVVGKRKLQYSVA